MKSLSIFLTAGIPFVLQCSMAFALARKEPAWNNANAGAAVARANNRSPTVAYRQMPSSAVPGVVRQALESDGQSYPADPTFLGEAAANGNFQLIVPIARFPGRGFDLEIAMRYSSRVWARIGNDFVFDPDADWPAPGWSLGFGSLSDGVLIDADNSRHALVSLDALHARTADGTRIDLTWATNTLPRRITAAYPDGHTVDFLQTTNRGTAYPVRIADRNGNFITLNYREPNTAALATITDTMGRTITFQYDAANRLAGIDGPGVNGASHSYAGFSYRHINRRLRLPNGRNDQLDDDFLEAILLQRDGSAYNGYWFGGANAYTSLGMLREIAWQTGMRKPDGGSVRPGAMQRMRSYDFAPSVPAGDLPRYSAMTETWTGGSAPNITRYDVRQNGPIRELETTYPDGTHVLQASNETPGLPGTGLVYLTSIADNAASVISRQITEWETGANGVPRVKSVERTNATSGDTLRVEYRYGPNNEVTEVRDLNYDGSLLRRTTLEYVSGAAYDQQHIFTLAAVIQVFDGENAMPASRTEYFYDANALQATPGVVQQLTAYSDPMMILARGNVTKIVRYADAAARTGALEETRTYDVTGNVVSIVRGNTRTTFAITATTQFAFPDSIGSGSSAPNSPLLLSEHFEYNVQLGTIAARTNTDNVRTGFTFDPDTLEVARQFTKRLSTRFTRQDAGRTRTRETRDSAGGLIDRVVAHLDGRGRVVRTESLAQPAVPGGFLQPAKPEIVEVLDWHFDSAGRLDRKSLPYRSGSIDVHWVSYGYDALSRLTRVTMEDGTESRTLYDETQRPPDSSASKGSTVRTVDRAGRERWYRTDALGRLAEVVEPNPAGGGSVQEAGGLATLYTYNVLGNLLRVAQGPQIRDFGYDSLGRLRRQRVPERTANLDGDGRFWVGRRNPGIILWSDVFGYDNFGRFASLTDARGVRTVFDYGNDPLNRLQQISYDTTSFGDTAHPILPAAAVRFDYVTSGDLRHLDHVTIGKDLVERYTYTSEGRLSSLTTTFTNFPARPLAVNYDYDDAGRIVRTSYPSQWNAPSAGRRDIVYTWLGRLNTIDVGSGWKLSVTDYEPGGLLAGWRWGIETVASVPLGPGLDGSALVPVTFGLADSMSYDRRNLNETAHDLTPIFPITGAPLMQLASDYEKRPLPGGPTLELDGDVAPPPSILDKLTSESDSKAPATGRQFWYDALGRLVRAHLGVSSGQRVLGNLVQSYQSSQEYQYDRFGNRVNVRAAGPPLPVECLVAPCPPVTQELPADQIDGWRNLAIDPASNHIATAGFEYDAAGNLVAAPQIAGGTQRYQYDAAGRLGNVKDGAGQLLERYAYGFGRSRIATFGGGQKPDGTIYAWAGGYVIAEYDATADDLRWRKSFIRGGPRVLGSFSLEQNREGLEIYTNDRVGARLVTRADVDAKSLSPSRTDALPFGRRVGAPGQTARFANFARSSTTGLDYATNRFYAPEVGRFLEADPLGAGAIDRADPQSFNPYSFARNDPVNRGDPAGLMSRKITLMDEDCLANQTEEWGIQACAHTYDLGEDAAGPGSPALSIAGQSGQRHSISDSFRNEMDVLNLGRGLQFGGGAWLCLVLCFGGDLHVGIYQEPNTEEITPFVTLGMAPIGPGPPANQSYDPPRTNTMMGMGLGLTAGFDAQAFVTRASTYSDFSGWSLSGAASVPGASISLSENANGQGTIAYGPAGGYGGGLAIYPTMTFPQR